MTQGAGLHGYIVASTDPNVRFGGHFSALTIVGIARNPEHATTEQRRVLFNVHTAQIQTLPGFQISIQLHCSTLTIQFDAIDRNAVLNDDALSPACQGIHIQKAIKHGGASTSVKSEAVGL